MNENEKNLDTKRFKTCGHAKPVYDLDGHFEEIACHYGCAETFPGFCGEIACPLDREEEVFDEETT